MTLNTIVKEEDQLSSPISINKKIATELNVKTEQVKAAVDLLDDGATVPFIARYRKEATNSLDDVQLRQLEERLIYLREMEERRSYILKTISEQNKLTPELQKAISQADSKHRLEDLFLPYKKKRKTKGEQARQAGIEPLADLLFGDPEAVPTTAATAFINEEAGYKDEKAVLDGAKYILMERFSENAEILSSVREFLNSKAHVISKVAKEKSEEKSAQKYRDYFEHNESISNTPSHRALAILRGRREGVLQVKVDLPPKELEDTKTAHPCESIIARHIEFKAQDTPRDKWLTEVVNWAWRIKIHNQMENELISDLKSRAEDEAILVFSTNLKDLLMAAPAGPKNTLGLDPGLRTGVKVVAVDSTGKLTEHTTIFPHEPKKEWDQSIETLAKLCKKHNIDLISIGNGTASRETDRLVSEMLKKHESIKAVKLIISEAGASVYSASAYASKEFPDLDVSYRGAVSIARRLQDPLAELVKIDPKSIGVGQYQHDANQVKLARALDAVVEDCVNAVGVDVNTASAPLLSKIAGLNQLIADNIVNYRDQHGAFQSREKLKEVPRLGNKTFEQAAGFLRVMSSDNPLDRSAVHPEAYDLVVKIGSQHNRNLESLINAPEFLHSLSPEEYVTERFGLPTIKDILKELEKPGRDPRPEFKTAKFKEGVETINDLKSGMILEGVISNVANFGAFVDLGVHHDGLIHISLLSDKFISNPREVVKTGDIVKVKVVEVDTDRNRIGLSRVINERAVTGSHPHSNGDKGQQNERNSDGKPKRKRPRKETKNQGGKPPVKSFEDKSKGGTFADLFANAKQIRSKR